MKPAEALLLLTEIVKGKKHKNYNRTVKLAKLYRQLFTGEDIDELIIAYSPREDEDTLNVRKKFTELLCPSWSASIMSIFSEVFRVPPNVKRYHYKDENNQEQLRGLTEAIDNYFGKNSIETYQKDIIHEQSLIDPNSFVVTDTLDFDNTKEKAKPFPVIVSAENAYYVSLLNDVLQVLVQNYVGHYYINSKNEKKEAKRFILYAAGYSLIFEEVNPEKVSGAIGFINIKPEELPDLIDISAWNRNFGNGVYYKVAENEVYEIKYAYNGFEEVNVIRLGYRRDSFTKRETFVSPLQPAVPFFKKSIQRISECDITFANHAFPQKLQYTEPCSTDQNNMCTYSNELVASCSKCNGTGFRGHKTASDAVSFPLPKDGRGGIDSERIIELSKLIYYAAPNIDIIKLLVDEVDSLHEQGFIAVFNTEASVKTGLEQTATGKRIEKENQYNAIYPYGSFHAEFWVQTVKFIAAWRDENKDLVVEYSIPSDFKLLTLDELMAQYESANNAKLPATVKKSILFDIVKKQYANQPDLLKRYVVKQQFMPLASKDESEIKFLFTAGLIPRRDMVLYGNFDRVFTEAETQEGFKFYDYAYDKQKAIIDTILETLLSELDANSGNTAKPFGE